MIYIVQHPMNGALLGADRRTFILPGKPGDVWTTRDEDEARRMAEVSGGKAIPVGEPPTVARMPMGTPAKRGAPAKA